MQEELEKLIETTRLEKDPISQAKFIHYLVRDKGVRVKDLSKSLSMKESYLCHLLRLVKLPEIVLDGYYSHLISLSHLFIISRLKKEEDMVSLYEKILSQDLSASRAEFEVRKVLYGVKSDGSYVPENEVSEYILKIGSPLEKIKVQVIQSRIKSKVVIEAEGSLKDTSPVVRKVLERLRAIRD